MAALHGFLDKVHDGLPVSAEELFVIPVGKPFQVYIHRVNIGEKLAEDFQVRGAVGDHDVEHPVFMHQLRGIPDVFPADQRLIVGVGHADVFAGQIVGGQVGQPLRGHALCLDGEIPIALPLGNFMILAEGAAEIAAQAAHGQDHFARVKLLQRFFLDRIKGQRGNPAVIQRFNPAADCGSRAAGAGLSVVQFAVPETYVAESHLSIPSCQ